MRTASCLLSQLADWVLGSLVHTSAYLAWAFFRSTPARDLFVLGLTRYYTNALPKKVASVVRKRYAPHEQAGAIQEILDKLLVVLPEELRKEVLGPLKTAVQWEVRKDGGSP